MPVHINPSPSDQAIPTAVCPSGTWRMLDTAAAPRPKLPKGLDAAFQRVVGHVVSLVPRRHYYMQRAQRIAALADQFRDLSDAHLRDRAAEMRQLYRLGRQTRRDVDIAFALIREVGKRQLGIEAHPEQIAAAVAMNNGCLTELATGEGKTLAATMPATIAGWRGRGCHIITVNDYLAKRDAEWMNAVYSFCGLSVGYVEGPMEPPARRAAYLADITYATNKEVAADFLRDRLALGRKRDLPVALLSKIADRAGRGPDHLVMRGLEMAIVDEADSVLIDEAVTPLIISSDAPNPEQIEAFSQAAAMASQLQPKRHYRINHRYRDVDLTPAGRSAIANMAEQAGGVFKGIRRREELVTQALSARELFLLDKQYTIQEDKVVIVDEFTGRLMPDRSWRDGLHQAVEAKEQVEVTAPKLTLARISFQRFFRLYRKLAGMTGTCWESRAEMWQIYHMPVVRIPTHRPCIRKRMRDGVYGNAQAKWQAIIDRIRQLHESGRPILVGTRSIQSSEHLSQLLEAEGLEHQVLNAVRHAEEADVVAQAGQPGRITVATNMAGRGTDIQLGRGVADAGGLHVLATERHESGRVDRQLFGRAGRQGDPGSAEAIVCMSDELVQRYIPPWGRVFWRTLSTALPIVTDPLNRAAFAISQRRAQFLAARQRKSVLKADDWLDEYLGFAERES